MIILINLTTAQAFYINKYDNKVIDTHLAYAYNLYLRADSYCPGNVTWTYFTCIDHNPSANFYRWVATIQFHLMSDNIICATYGRSFTDSS